MSPECGLIVLALVGGLAAVGCGSTATLTVTRPAQINVRAHGGTVTVVPFAGQPQGAKLVTDELVERVRRAPAGAVRYAPRGGGVIVQGTVLEHHVAQHERLVPSACPRSALGTHGARYTPSSSCLETQWDLHARVEVLFEVISVASDRRLASLTLVDSMSRSSRSSYGRPAIFQPDSMLAELRQGILDRFATVILPWRETVRVRIGRCGDAREHCTRGREAMRAGELRLAARAFRRAITQLRRAGGADERHLAQAYRNYGLALEYQGEFDRAIAAFRRARRLDPDDDDTRRELRNVERLEEERRELERQGVR